MIEYVINGSSYEPNPDRIPSEQAENAKVVIALCVEMGLPFDQIVHVVGKMRDLELLESDSIPDCRKRIERYLATCQNPDDLL